MFRAEYAEPRIARLGQRLLPSALLEGNPAREWPDSVHVCTPNARADAAFSLQRGGCLLCRAVMLALDDAESHAAEMFIRPRSLMNGPSAGVTANAASFTAISASSIAVTCV
jgi:hypothetical protein